MTTFFILATVTMIAFLVSYVVAQYTINRAARVTSLKRQSDDGDKQALVGRVQELEGKLATVGGTVLPITAAFQQVLVRELTHFHTPEMDELMTRIGPPSTLSDEEETRLAELLEARTRDMGDEITASEREAAAMLPSVMKRAKAEFAAIEEAQPMVLKVVAIPTPAEKP